jgi:hypothetical protein
VIASSEVEPAAVVQATVEHAIDDFMSESLIEPDRHHRLPEPPKPPAQDDLALGGMLPEAPEVGEPTLSPELKVSVEPQIEHHVMKVIAPLGPIESGKEHFARELAELKAAAEPATPLPTPAPTLQPKVVSAVPAEVDDISLPPVETVPPPAIIRHIGALLPTPVAVSNDDFSLPQAESLAVDDVARARAAAEAESKLHLPPAALPQKLSVAEVLAQPAAEIKHPIQSTPTTPIEPPATAAVPLSTPASKRRARRRDRDHKAGEHASLTVDVKHYEPKPSPPPAEAKRPQLTGTLIMPTGDRPRPTAAFVPAVKPKKLAPGEVFVDENGNVVIGD